MFEFKLRLTCCRWSFQRGFFSPTRTADSCATQHETTTRSTRHGKGRQGQAVKLRCVLRRPESAHIYPSGRDRSHAVGVPGAACLAWSSGASMPALLHSARGRGPGSACLDPRLRACLPRRRRRRTPERCRQPLPDRRSSMRFWPWEGPLTGRWPRRPADRSAGKAKGQGRRRGVQRNGVESSRQTDSSNDQGGIGVRSLSWSGRPFPVPVTVDDEAIDCRLIDASGRRPGRRGRGIRRSKHAAWERRPGTGAGQETTRHETGMH